MKKKILNLCLFLFLANIALFAQEGTPSEKNDFTAITETIQMYFDGWMTGDTSKIGYAMHATCQLKTIRDGKVAISKREKYLSFFQPKPKMENTSGRIVRIEITGNIAAAKCEIDTPKSLFTDYFNMLKLEGRWYIVDKIATRINKE